jgi:hypothetical protein
MDLPEKSLKSFLFIFTIAVIIVIGSSLILRFYNERNYPEKFGKQERTKNEEEVLPQIINKPNENIDIGEEFVFIPKVSSSDYDFNINLVKSPEWMVLQEGIIMGVPYDSGTFEYVVRLISGAHHYDEKFYLVVRENFDE